MPAIYSFMTPLKQYQQDLNSGLINADPQQRTVIEHFESLHAALAAQARRSPSLLDKILPAFLRRKNRAGESPRGLYLWGGVGRGKTYMMDLFFESVDSPRKLRTHFHRFMHDVHQQLSARQGEKNPLQGIAQSLAERVDLLCFDEFFVLDIGDAMILAGLLEALFNRGVVLVATSNIYPDGLYENGLQRQRFLPAIALIKQHTTVLEIGAGTDYRLRSLSQATLYLSPITADTESELKDSFEKLAPDNLDRQDGGEVMILGRAIPCLSQAGDVAWFTFAALCDGPRSAADYVELARLYHAILISDVPALDDNKREQVRRFVNLVDELYDRRVKLIMAAEAPLPALYSGQSLAFEFERTQSRLIEMQSHEYLGSEHRG